MVGVRIPRLYQVRYALRDARLTENARKNGMVYGSERVWETSISLPFGVVITIFRNRAIHETIDPATGKVARCDKRGRLL